MIKLLRHGKLNNNEVDLHSTNKLSYSIPLSETGLQQSKRLADHLSDQFILSSSIYCSPYLSTRQTLTQLLQAKNINPKIVSVVEDPRLRENPSIYNNSKEDQNYRRVHGWFYKKYKDSESPAEVYDRTASFVDNLKNQIVSKSITDSLIICHGITLRCIVTHFLSLSIEQFEDMHNPKNCEIITIAPKDKLNKPIFSHNDWGVEGIKLRGLLRPID